jgi:hypothetical protein
MVTQKPAPQFLGKVKQFFRDKTTPERQRSGVVHSTFRRRSDVVQMTVQAGSTETILDCLKKAFRLAVCPKNIVQPGASCGFLEILHKNYFWARKFPERVSP